MMTDQTDTPEPGHLPLRIDGGQVDETAVEELTLGSRREIYQLIAREPGIHFKALARRLNQAEGTIQYHLRQLSRANFIEIAEHSKYTRYYPADEYDTQDKQVIDCLRRKTARQIIAHLYEHGDLTTNELAEECNRDDSTVSWHLSRLANSGVVEKERDGQYVYHQLVDPDHISRLYVTHKQGRVDNFVDGFCDVWDLHARATETIK